MKFFKLFAASAATIALVSGCASTSDMNETALVESDVEAQRIADLERRNAELMEETSKLRGMSQKVAEKETGTDLPPAKPGECYTRILQPATYETVSEQVVDQPASEDVEIIPAKYKWVEETVVVSEASERIEVIPATYKTITEEVIVEPARTETKTVPAKYDTITEKVVVREAYTVWKKGEGSVGDNVKDTKETATGEIMCLVEVPAEYKTVERRVLVSPARTENVEIPAVTKTVEKRVIDQPSTTRKVVVPAKTETVRVRKMVSPEEEKRTAIPPTYRTVTKKVKVEDEKRIWREVVCKTNATSDIVLAVQRALKEEGFDPGKIDGKLGDQTIRAVSAYQRANGLGTGGLTMETAKKLGVL